MRDLFKGVIMLAAAYVVVTTLEHGQRGDPSEAGSVRKRG